MTNLAEALPKEIKRVTGIKENWMKMSMENPMMANNMSLGIHLMRCHIEEAIDALAIQDVSRMMASYQSLIDYTE